jgi:hypothetical protein
VKVAGEYVKAVQAMDQKCLGTAPGVVGPTEQALADHSHGGVVGASSSAPSASAASLSTYWSRASASSSESKATPRWGIALLRWEWGWAMTHWRESAQPHVAQLGARDGRVLGARQEESRKRITKRAIWLICAGLLAGGFGVCGARPTSTDR